MNLMEGEETVCLNNIPISYRRVYSSTMIERVLELSHVLKHQASSLPNGKFFYRSINLFNNNNIADNRNLTK